MLTEAAKREREHNFAAVVERSSQVGRIAGALGYGLTSGGGGKKVESVKMSPHVCR